MWLLKNTQGKDRLPEDTGNGKYARKIYRTSHAFSVENIRVGG